MDDDIHKEIVDSPADAALWLRRQEDELHTQKGDEDQGSPDRLHVGRWLGTVGLLQFGDENSDDVQEK